MMTLESTPPPRGRLLKNEPMSRHTSWRVGGPADSLYVPADLDDLVAFLKRLPANEPVHWMGLGSNLLVRDGGIHGTVIATSGALGGLSLLSENTVRAETGVASAKVARFSTDHGLGGAEFLAGIPGTVGGALAMNAGAYTQETKDILVEAVAFDRAGNRRILANAEMGFAYRRCFAADGLIFTQALFEGRKDEPAAIDARMADIMKRREASQPVRERTGGSTFANPDPELSGGLKAWQLIDKVGGRGRIVGDAQCSELHCNFMINRGKATGADIENLVEGLRIDVKRETAVELHWEIKRVGEVLGGGV